MGLELFHYTLDLTEENLLSLVVDINSSLLHPTGFGERIIRLQLGREE
jgi:hypothetical protein